MDRSLDEIVAESQHRKQGPRPRRGGGGGGRGGGGGGGGGRPRERDAYPRDGVRKSTRDDSRNMDSEWVHDRFEDSSNSYGRSRQPRRRQSPDQSQETRGTKIKVDNLHYELTEGDLEGLFGKIGTVSKVEIIYDRAGRSDGTAFVTYERYKDAEEAIREFDGANAKGQPIRLRIMPSAPKRNPFDNAHMPGRPLADRISVPSGRSRSLSPGDAAHDRGIDRYVPGRRSRSPLPPRRGGRRPGARREGGNAAPKSDEPRRANRPKKTAEELDAEMADYFGPGSGDANAAAEPAAGAAPAAAAGAGAPAVDDVDMIE